MSETLFGTVDYSKFDFSKDEEKIKKINALIEELEQTDLFIENMKYIVMKKKMFCTLDIKSNKTSIKTNSKLFKNTIYDFKVIEQLYIKPSSDLLEIMEKSLGMLEKTINRIDLIENVVPKGYCSTDDAYKEVVRIPLKHTSYLIQQIPA